LWSRKRGEEFGACMGGTRRRKKPGKKKKQVPSAQSLKRGAGKEKANTVMIHRREETEEKRNLVKAQETGKKKTRSGCEGCLRKGEESQHF